MRKLLVWGLLPAAIVGVALHVAVVRAIPGLIMTRAIETIEGRVAGWNEWTAVPQVTPANQTVVRSSPDLAYAICMVDLSDGPVTVSALTWDGYGSLSIFDADTANLIALSLTDTQEKERAVIVALEGQVVDTSEQVVRVSGAKVIALVRRLAPDAALQERAATLALQGQCAPA